MLLSVVFDTQLRYADERIVNIMKVYIKGNNLKLELIGYDAVNLFDYTLYSRLLLRSDGFNAPKSSPTMLAIR